MLPVVSSSYHFSL